MRNLDRHQPLGLTQAHTEPMNISLPFADRESAARALAEALQSYRGQRPLILAMPRGGVPMGQVVAAALQGELDIVQVRKLGATFNPEYAIGAVAENGWRYLSPVASELGMTAAEIEQLTRVELQRMQARRRAWTGEHAPASPTGRVVIVVDDGVATGASMIAALHALRDQQPKRLIVAVPVAAPDSLEKLRSLADDTVCLAAPAGFRAVGQYYRDFSQVEDDEVAQILAPLKLQTGPSQPAAPH